jgi:hypothetical protein
MSRISFAPSLRVAIGVIGAGLAGRGLAAQDRPPIETGSTVRVTSAGKGLVAQEALVREVRRDTLVLESADSARGWTLSREEINQLDIRTGHHSRTVLGLKVGLAIGGGAGFLLGLAGCEDGLFSKSECVSAAAVASSLLGVTVGGVVGALSHKDTWSSGATAAPVVRPVGRGMGIGLAIRF